MTKLRFQIWLVYRFVAARKRIFALPSMVSLIGLAAGVACMTLAMGVVSGFESTLRSAVVDVFGHVLIVRKVERVTDVEAAFGKIKEIAPEAIAFTPFLQMEGIVANAGRISGVVVQGLEAKSVDSVLRLRQRVTKGRFDLAPSADGTPSALVGKGIAARFGFKIGDTFQVVLPTPSKANATEFHPRAQAFKLVGVLDLGKNDYDERYVVTDLKAAQKLGDVGEGFSGLRLLLENPADAPKVADRLRRKLGSTYYLMDWFEVNKNLFEAVAFERFVIFFVMMTMIVAAAFNVSSNLFVSVVRRFADVSILKAIGFSRMDAMQMFALHGFFFGLIGTTAGLVLGLVFCGLFDGLQRWFSLIPAEIYKIDRIGVSLRITDVVAIAAASMIICLLAALAPAWRGSRLNPVEGLRYE